MLLLATSSLPAGDDWEYELKLDGYRAIGFKSNGNVHLRSRNNKDFAVRYPAIAKGLQKLRDETVIDGEVVALDDSGRPSFNTLQKYGSSTAPIFYYAFDLLILNGWDVRFQPLETRRELLRTIVLWKLREPVRYSPDLDASLPDLVHSAREQGLEGFVAKRRTSVYESGLRSGAWLKDAREPRARVRDRRIHSRPEELRCTDLWLLRRGQAHLCGQNPERIHAGITRGTVSALSSTRDRKVSFHQSGSQKRPLGTGSLPRRRWKIAAG